MNRQSLLPIFVLLCTTSIQSAFGQPLKSDEKPMIRWVPSTDNHYLCGGYYQEPLLKPKDKQVYSMSLPITLSADSSSLSAHGSSSLIGNVTVIQGNRFLSTDETWVHRIAHNNQIRSITAKGHIFLTEPGLQITGDEAEMHFGTKRTWIDNANFILSTKHAHGYAEKISLDENHVITLKNAYYSTCTPNHSDWEIAARKIRLNRDSGRGEASRVHLYIKNKPLLYFPYINFPIDKRRQSGFLYPSFENSTQSGTTLSFPYYWSMASNYDAIITPQVMSLRGIQTQALFRYLSSYQESKIHFSFLPHDRQYEHFRNNKLLSYASNGLTNNDPRVLALEKGGARMALSWQDALRWNDHWSGQVNYNWVSDDNHFIDLNNDIINVSNTHNLPQEALVKYDGKFWHNFLKIQKFQTLHPYESAIQSGVYQRQPQFGFNMRDPNIWHHLQYEMNGDWVNFFHSRDPQTQYSFTKGSRLHIRPGIRYPFYETYGYWIPGIQLDYTQYNLTRGTQDRAYDRGSVTYRALPILDSDASLYFERSSYFLKTPYQQTFEPRLYYVYIPRHTQNSIPNFDSGTIDFGYDQLFRSNRFSGYDRLGDANQLSIAATTRFLNERRIEKFRFSIGQIVYFQDRNVSLCDQVTLPGCRLRENPEATHKTSAIAAFMRYYITPQWRLDNDLEWNTHQHFLDKNSINLTYQGPDNQILNLGYEYLRRDPTLVNLEQDGGNFQLEQTDISFAWPLSGQWRGIARWHYDLAEKRSIDLLGGAEYNSCCIALQVVSSRYLRDPEGLSASPYANAIFVRFLLKGLSTIGTNQDSRNLSRDIPGFRSFANTEYVKK